MPENRDNYGSERRRDSLTRSHPASHPAPYQSLPDPAISSTPSRPGSSFAARFGRVILSHGIAVLPTALYHMQGLLDLSAQQVWFVSNILSYKWDEDLPYPSLNKMARCGGIDKTQLYDYKDRLCKRGLLLVYPRQDASGKRETNVYDFAPLFGKLEDLIAAERGLPNPIRGEGADPDQFGAEMADSSFVARYGRVISGYGVTAVPRAIFTHGAALGLSLQQVWFITYIFSYRWDTPLPYPSIKKMSALTGYSTVQLHNIKSELVQSGYLRLVARYTADGGQDSNAYDFSGLLDSITGILQEQSSPEIIQKPEPPPAPQDERSPRRGRKPGTPGTPGSIKPRAATPSIGAGGALLSGVGGAELTWAGGSELSDYGGDSLTGVGGGRLTGGSGEGLPAPTNAAPPSIVVQNYQGQVVRGLHKKEPLKESHKSNDSNQHPLQQNGPGDEANSQPHKYSPYIAAIASDFSRDLGDTPHEVSNMKQALNLWQASGLSEHRFADLMHEARNLTRRYQARPTWDKLNNKMAYFFATLRDLIEQVRSE